MNDAENLGSRKRLFGKKVTNADDNVNDTDLSSSSSSTATKTTASLRSGDFDPSALIDVESIVDQVLRDHQHRAPADAYAPRRRDSLVAHARRFARHAWRRHPDHEKLQ